MEGPGNSIISEVTGDDAFFPFSSSLFAGKVREVSRSGAADRSDLNDVKGLRKSKEIEMGKRRQRADVIVRHVPPM